MARPPRLDNDDEETSIFDDSKRRPKPDTRRGHEQATIPELHRAKRSNESQEEFRKRAIELATPTSITPDAPVPQAVVHGKSEPIRVISMKTPHDPKADKQALEGPRKAHVVKLRAISELSGPGIQVPMGNLAPPRDAKQARMRRARDYVIVGLAVVIVGCLVMIAVWFLARR